DLVGIEDEDPVISERKIFQSPILLFWPGAVEMKLFHLCAALLSDLRGVVSALGIDHKNFIRPLNRTKATRQIRRFVFDRNNDRNRNSRSHRGRITRHGLPAAMTSSGTSLVTTEHAPTTARAPIFTPGKTNARAPMNASSPIVIFATVSGIAGSWKLCVPLLR